MVLLSRLVRDLRRVRPVEHCLHNLVLFPRRANCRDVLRCSFSSRMAGSRFLRPPPSQRGRRLTSPSVTITSYLDAAHRSQVVALWKTVFAYDAPHNEPSLAIDKKLAV